MPQSLSKVIIHIIYSTKDRKPFLQSKELRDELYAYKAAVLDSSAVLINGMPDHVHVLCLLSRKCPIADLVRVSKAETSKWVKRQGPSRSGFQWQSGYGAFSVSESNVEQVRQYIANQERHHARRSFQDEFREICRRHGVELDEGYVWD